jgi:hypothetical protein
MLYFIELEIEVRSSVSSKVEFVLSKSCFYGGIWK